MPVKNNPYLVKLEQRIQTINKVGKKDIINNELVDKGIVSLNDIVSLKNELQKWPNILNEIKEKFINLNFKSSGEMITDEQQLTNIPLYIEKLNNFIGPRLEELTLKISYKCAKWLFTNDFADKLEKLFELSILKEIKDKIMFIVAKRFIEEGNINYIKMLKTKYDSYWTISKLIDDEKKQDNLFHVAVANGQLEILEFLFDLLKDDEISAEKNQFVYSLLESAFKYSAKEFVETNSFISKIIPFLLEKIDSNWLEKMIKVSENRTIVHVAAMSGDIDGMKALIEKLEDPLLINKLMRHYGTPLQIAIMGSSITYDKTGVPIAGEDWIPSFANLLTDLLKEISFDNIDSIEIDSLVKNYKKIAKYLLSILTPEQINSKDKEGDTAIHECVYRSNLEMLKLVLENKGDINAQNEKGNTPLHCAILFAKLPVIKMLLESKEIDLRLTNGKRATAYELLLLSDARQTDKGQIAQLFKKAFENQGLDVPFIRDSEENLQYQNTEWRLESDTLRYMTNSVPEQNFRSSSNVSSQVHDVEVDCDVVDTSSVPMETDEFISIWLRKIGNFIEPYSTLPCNNSQLFPTDVINDITGDSINNSRPLSLV